MDFTKHFATRLRHLVTPQREPIPNTPQVANSAGGYAWPVDQWTRLDRFLVLGSEGGTFYVGERELTRENAQAVVECLASDGARVVRRIVEVSVAGRAPKNDPALFALAIAAGVGDADDQGTGVGGAAAGGAHRYAPVPLAAVREGVPRVGSWRATRPWLHGTPRSRRRGAAPGAQVPEPDGWAHRDALRLAHPKAPSVAHDLVFRYATKGWEGVLARGCG